MDVKDFAGEYALRADEELLLLAASAKDLTEEAQAALAEELAKRGLQPPPPPQPPPIRVVSPPIRIVVRPEQTLVSRQEGSLPWQVLWFFLHVLTVYIVVALMTFRLAFVTRSLVGLVFEPVANTNPFQFLFAHLFVFSVMPGFVAGLFVARFNVKAAKYAWVIPTLILVLRVATFSVENASVMSQHSPSHWLSALQYFFIADAADLVRGMTQFRIVSPLYAAVAYSVAAVVARRSRLHEAIDHSMNGREEPGW